MEIRMNCLSRALVRGRLLMGTLFWALSATLAFSAELANTSKDTHRMSSKEQPDGKRLFEKEVNSILNESAEGRAERYYARTKNMNVFWKATEEMKNQFNEFCREVVLQEDYRGIRCFEAKLFDDSKKRVLWLAVMQYGRDSENAQKLLRHWATENESVPVLLRYHPNGVHLLLEMAQTKDIDSTKRALCVRFVSEIHDPRVLPALKRLREDETEVNEVSAETPKTLGDIVRECISKIEGNKDGEPDDLPSKSAQPQSGNETDEVENETPPDADIAPEEGAAVGKDQPHSTECNKEGQTPINR